MEPALHEFAFATVMDDPAGQGKQSPPLMMKILPVRSTPRDSWHINYPISRSVSPDNHYKHLPPLKIDHHYTMCKSMNRRLT